jgi:small multidrug resistance pump
MSAYLLLVLAIGFEIAATLGLKASDGWSRPGISVLVALGYVASIGLLGLSLKQGLNLSIGYALWAAVGTAAVAVLSVWIFSERLGPLTIAGIAIVIVGVVLIEVGSTSHEPESGSVMVRDSGSADG